MYVCKSPITFGGVRRLGTQRDHGLEKRKKSLNCLRVSLNFMKISFHFETIFCLQINCTRFNSLLYKAKVKM